MTRLRSTVRNDTVGPPARQDPQQDRHRPESDEEGPYCRLRPSTVDDRPRIQADTEADDDRDDEADEYGEQESAHGG